MQSFGSEETESRTVIENKRENARATKMAPFSSHQKCCGLCVIY